MLTNSGVKQVIEKTEAAGMNAPTAPAYLADDDVARLRVPPHSIEAEQSVLAACCSTTAHGTARATC